MTGRVISVRNQNNVNSRQTRMFVLGLPKPYRRVLPARDENDVIFKRRLRTCDLAAATVNPVFGHPVFGTYRSNNTLPHCDQAYCLRPRIRGHIRTQTRRPYDENRPLR